MFHTIRTLRSGVLRSAAWRPANARLLAGQVLHRAHNAHAGYRDADHLRAAAEWLRRAHDATEDGGVSGRYLLRGGWTSSYPETTGYIIPTFIALTRELGTDEFMDRARRCVDFLQSVRLPSGAFPGGEVRENRSEPSVFNSAQIINGLVAWYQATREQRALDMAIGAGDWLVSMLDDDGAWRRHVYRGTPVAYASHASCWLAQLGECSGERKYLDAARRNMEWVLAQQDAETGWFDRAGWDETHVRERYAETHTIAYTIWGVLYTALACHHPAGIAAARLAAQKVARRLELSRRLPGKLNAEWKPRATYQCLTGNAQMALIWLRLDELASDPPLVNSAMKAIDLVKAAQPMDSPNPGIRGGVPGSDPVWGDYISYGLPNWAAKFHIDALLAKKAAIERFRARAESDAAWQPPAAIHRALPSRAPGGETPVRVVMYTRPRSHKVQQMVDAWSAWGFKPLAVVVEEGTKPTLPARTIAGVREHGVRGLLAKVARARLARPGSTEPSRHAARTSPDLLPVEEYCARRAIPMIRVVSLDSPEAADRIRALMPDLAIHAGCGILRRGVLDVPRIGTINAHMGLLPRYRGMNVAEWARILGGPTGCSVHFVDAGIDTGDIICVRQVNTGTARSIAELRAMIDAAQIQLLGEVTQGIMTTGARPAAYEQQTDEGLQFFVLHPDIAAVLESELR